jgi:putative heme transporter
VTLDADYEPPVSKVTWRQLLQSAAGFVIAAALLVFGLPRVAQTNWTEIWRQFTMVNGWSAALMLVLMLAGLYCYTFTLIGSLPGLTHLRALMVNAAGSMVSNMLPAGGALGVALSYVMYRSWGFTRRNISTSLVVTGVWNIMARLLLPVVAILIVIFGPVDAPPVVEIGSGIAAAIGIALLAVFVALIYSDRLSHLVARTVERVGRPFSKRLRAGVDLNRIVQDQRARTSNVVEQHGLKMSLGLAGMFGFFFVLYVVACRAVGVDMPYVELFVAYAFRQFLTVVAITPGGLGITEAGTAGILVAFGADPGAAAAAALLYAVFTHLLEVPLGLAAWAGWWWSPKRRTTHQLGEDGRSVTLSTMLDAEREGRDRDDPQPDDSGPDDPPPAVPNGGPGHRGVERGTDGNGSAPR